MKYLVETQRAKNTKKTIKTKKKRVEKNRNFAISLKKTRDRSRRHNSFFASSLFFENFVKFKRDKKYSNNNFNRYKQRRDNSANSITKEKSFKIVNVNYFDSYLLESYSQDDIIILKEKIYYKDIYFFIEIVKSIVKLTKNHVVRIKLYRCFRDTT